MRDDRLRLEDMLGGIESALAFTANKARQDLDSDRLLRSALLHELSVIGEAAGRISPDLQNRYIEVPWRVIADFRNQIVHSYFSLDLDIVWETVATDLPALRDSILRILQQS